MTAAGNSCTVIEYPGAGHAFHQPHRGHDFHAVVAATAEFLIAAST